jgi:hypothetical protein
MFSQHSARLAAYLQWTFFEVTNAVTAQSHARAIGLQEQSLAAKPNPSRGVAFSVIRLLADFGQFPITLVLARESYSVEFRWQDRHRNALSFFLSSRK